MEVRKAEVVILELTSQEAEDIVDELGDTNVCNRLYKVLVTGIKK